MNWGFTTESINRQWLEEVMIKKSTFPRKAENFLHEHLPKRFDSEPRDLSCESNTLAPNMKLTLKRFIQPPKLIVKG